jgi:hypothetical protein
MANVVRVKTHQGIKNVQIAGETPTEEELQRVNEAFPEISVLRQLAYGFESTPTDLQNAGLLLEAYFPISPFYDDAEQVEGSGITEEQYRALTPDQRRQFLVDKRDQKVSTEYGDVISAGLADSATSTVGGFLGAIATPTSLIPLGRAVPTMAAIGATLGAEWSVLDQFAVKGEVDPKQVGVSAAVGGVAAPALGVAVGKISKILSKKRAATPEQVQAASETVDEITDARYKWHQIENPNMSEDEYVRFVTKKSADELAEAIAISGRSLDSIDPQLAKTLGEIPEGGIDAVARSKNTIFDDFFGSLTSQIERVHPEIGPWISNRLRRLDMNLHAETKRVFDEVNPFLKNLRSLSKNDRKLVDKSLFNGDFDEIRSVFKTRFGSDESFEVARRVLDDLHAKLKAQGANVGYFENYFPRMVKDYDGLVDSLGAVNKKSLDQALKAAQKKKFKKGKGPLTPSERARIVNTLLRGHPQTGKGRSFEKSRTIERLGDEHLPFYEDSIKSFDLYVRNALNEIEKRKFFGRGAKNSGPYGMQSLDTEASIGDFIEKGLRGRVGSTVDERDLGADQMNLLTDLLKARFINGEKGSHWTISGIRQLGYLTTLTNPISAMTQLGDIGVAAYSQGIANTLRAVLGPKRASMKQLGLDQVLSEELVNERVLAKFLHNMFTVSGFRMIDRLGKDVLLNSALLRAEKLARTAKGTAVLSKKYKNAFGDEFASLVDDLKAGNITDNVKLYLWNELSNAQPIALSEMPRKYLEAPNGRVFYSLKTFTLKQIDLMRRTIINEWKQGNRKGAVKNAVAYSLIVPGGATAVSYLKDGVLGRELSIDQVPDRYVDQALSLAFGSRYLIERYGAKGDITDMAKEAFMPPVQYIDSVWKTVAQRDPEILMKEMPVVGKFYYNFFGGGLEKHQERKEEERREEFKKRYGT